MLDNLPEAIFQDIAAFLSGAANKVQYWKTCNDLEPLYWINFIIGKYHIDDTKGESEHAKWHLTDQANPGRVKCRCVFDCKCFIRK